MANCSSCGGRLLPKATNCPHCNKFVEANAKKSSTDTLGLKLSHFLILGLVLAFCVGAQVVFQCGSLAFKAGDGISAAFENADSNTVICVSQDDPEIPAALASGATEVPSQDPSLRCFQPPQIQINAPAQ